MNLIGNYLKKSPKAELYVKYPVQITTALLKLCKQRYLLCSHTLTVGQWIAADIVFDGYSIPHTERGYDKEEECQKACDAHNMFCGWSQNQAIQIIDQALKNAHHQN